MVSVQDGQRDTVVYANRVGLQYENKEGRIANDPTKRKIKIRLENITKEIVYKQIVLRS